MRSTALRQRGSFTTRHIDRRFRDAVFLGLGAHPGSRRFMDSSVYQNHGTLVDEPQWEWSQEPNRWGIRYDGSNDGTTLPTAFAITTPYTVCMWLRPASVSTNLCFAGNWNGAGWIFRQGVSDGTALEFFDGGAALPSAAGVFSAGRLVHVAVTYDGTTIRLYADGSEVADSNGTALSGGSINLGRIPAGFNWPGTMYDPLVYPRALSPAEISVLADQTLQLVRQRRMAYVKSASSGLLLARRRALCS